MADSFQWEMPKARVNITVDIETGGARKKKELPLKLLVLGDFSRQPLNQPLAKHPRININKDNFNKVLKDLGPCLNLTVSNAIKQDGSFLPIQLQFNSFRDFHPDNIVPKVPELSKLLTMRNLLRDFKSNLIDNHTLRRVLETIITDKKRLQVLQTELRALIQPNQGDAHGKYH